MLFKLSSKKQKVKKHGGVVFFISLACLTILAFVNFHSLFALWNEYAAERWQMFIAGMFIGSWLASLIVRNHIRVLFHETKHAVFSNLVGNRSRGMTIKRNEGLFEYDYTRQTAHANAFIALAPYWLPLFTVPALILSLAWRSNPAISVLVVGIGYGADLLMNIRDVSPVQTDIQHVRGGYSFGIAYIVAINFVVATYLAAWVSYSWPGIQYLFEELWFALLLVYEHYNNQ